MSRKFLVGNNKGQENSECRAGEREREDILNAHDVSMLHLNQLSAMEDA